MAQGKISLAFLKRQLKQLEQQILEAQNSGDFKQYATLLRLYVSVQKGYVDMTKKMSSAEPVADDPLMLFNQKP